MAATRLAGDVLAPQYSGASFNPITLRIFLVPWSSIYCRRQDRSNQSGSLADAAPTHQAGPAVMPLCF
jgi:hypothetical protein